MVYSTEWMSHINAIGEDSYGNSCWYGMCMGTLFPLFSHKIGSLKFSSHTCPIVKNLVKLGPTPFPHTHVTFPYHSHTFALVRDTSSWPMLDFSWQSFQYGELPHIGKNLDRIRYITGLWAIINFNLTLNVKQTADYTIMG